MKTVCHDIFKAIFENKWLTIEYLNKAGETTKYWIGIKDINFDKQPVLVVDGLHVGKCTITGLRVFIDSIKYSKVIDGSYYETPEALKESITNNPEKYRGLFNSVANLQILNYLSDCNRMDSTPYQCEYSLIKCLDDDKIRKGNLELSDEQLSEIVMAFQSNEKSANNLRYKNLALNILSVYNRKKGLYVLAFRNLYLDVKNKLLRPDDNVTVCQEFSIDGNVQSIRYFLDADDFYLLDDFMGNLSTIEERISENNDDDIVDDMPYVLAIARDITVDLDYEYSGIRNMYENDSVSVPIKAFFGELLKQPMRKKNYPITLLNDKVNLDQLLAIHNAIKYPVTYVQGPPGSGKTNTIINVILTAFFNKKTLLFSSYNNHPIDGVYEKLSSVKYGNNIIPFPVLRLGNREKTLKAMETIKDLYDRVRNLTIYEGTLSKYGDSLASDSAKLTELMRKYEEILMLNERKETIEKLLESNNNIQFQISLQAIQLEQIEKRLKELGEITNEEAISLAVNNESFLKYLNFTSASYIKKLGEPRYQDLMNIIAIEDEDERLTEFGHYLSNDENIRKLQRVFPVIATTCISAHKLGSPKPSFDLTVIDEASQCNTAVSLIPIIRGENLMLVGDPNQLSPVILLQPRDNDALLRKYRVSPDYDYIKNSIYKTYLACDSVSVEILLSHHYRCHKKIIDFCNHKYYNSKLKVDTNNPIENPLVYINIPHSESTVKNVAPEEARAVVDYVKKHPDRQIGIITPFVRQKDEINDLLKAEGITNVTCGTVHAFQGDEKDEILFSTALSNRTTTKTYDWLKNHQELLNVAVSRGRNRLVVFASDNDLERLHAADSTGRDDLYELAQYVHKQGEYHVSQIETKSRALGIKPYSTEMEDTLLTTLNHALDNIFTSERKTVVKREVPIAQVFQDNTPFNDLFYSGRFDFVVYQKDYSSREYPVFAIELDGKEHFTDEVVKARDAKKNQICHDHGFDLIRIENCYARRYNYIKEILINYFSD